MPDFIFSSLPDEAQTAETYANLSSTPGERAAGTFFHEPTTTLVRKAEEAAYDPDAELFRSFIAGAAPEAGLTAADLRAPPSPMLSPEGANKLSPDGSPLTDKPIPQDLAHVLATHRAQKIEADSAIQRFDKQHWWPTNVGLDLAVGMADPLNLSTMLLPGLGEESVAARLGLSGFAGRAAARGIAGAAAGPIMQAPISALRLGVDDDYGLRDAMYDLAFQAPLSAAIGATAIGLPAEAVRWLRGMPATTRHAQMSAATAQLVEGKPLDVDFAPTPPETMTGVGQFMGHPFLEPRLRTPEPIETEGGRILRFPEPQRGRTAADLNALTAFAERQKALAETGYAPGMPQENLVAATQAVRQATETPAEVPTSTFDRAMSGEEKPPEGWASPVEPAAAEPAFPTPEVSRETPLPWNGPAPPDALALHRSGELSSTRAEQIRDELRTHERAEEDRIFGDDADRLRSLRRRSTGAWNRADDAKAQEYDRQIADIEEKIDPRELDRLSGVGAPETIDPDAWHELSHDLREAEDSRDVAVSLLSSKLRNLPNDLTKLTATDRDTLAVLGHAMDMESQRGGDPIALLRDAIARRVERLGGGADAEELAADYIRRLQQVMEEPAPAAEMRSSRLIEAPQQQEREAAREQQEPGGMFAPREEGTPEFPELAAAERQLASIDQEALLPEERGILMATEAEVRAADAKEGAYIEAANCLKDAGA